MTSGVIAAALLVPAQTANANGAAVNRDSCNLFGSNSFSGGWTEAKSWAFGACVIAAVQIDTLDWYWGSQGQEQVIVSGPFLANESSHLAIATSGYGLEILGLACC